MDAYALLGVARDASDNEIKQAYRVRARDVHPDKNPSPHAAQLFHAIKSASEVLLDGPARAALNRRLDARDAAAARLGAMDDMRAKLREELEAREREAWRGGGGGGGGRGGGGGGGSGSVAQAQDIERLRREGADRRAAFAERVSLEQSAAAAVAAAGLARRAGESGSAAAAPLPSSSHDLDLSLAVRVRWSEDFGVGINTGGGGGGFLVEEEGQEEGGGGGGGRSSGGRLTPQYLKSAFRLCGEVAYVLSLKTTGAVLLFATPEGAAAALAAPPLGFTASRVGGGEGGMEGGKGGSGQAGGERKRPRVGEVGPSGAAAPSVPSDAQQDPPFVSSSSHLPFEEYEGSVLTRMRALVN